MRPLLYGDVPGVQLRFGETNFQENRITRAAMRIFIQPRNGDSFERIIERTGEILTDAQTLSAHTDGVRNCSIHPMEFSELLAILRQAGMRVLLS
jgi:hypothetical protein